MRRLAAPVLAALVLLMVLPALAAAAAPGSGDRGRAEQALQRVQDLRRGIGVRTGRELTPALAELFHRRGALGAADRKTAGALLARPTDGGSDPQGDGYTTAEQPPHCGTRFCVHYVATTADAPPLADTAPANGIPDYVETMLNVFENEVFPCENGSSLIACSGSPGLGWPEAPSDGTRGGDGKFDVYLKQLGNQSIYGYVAPDPQPDGSSLFSYLVMDDDFSQAEFGYPDTTVPLRVTAAHEYNHVLQFGIESLQDTWMFESTATWSEDKVYPALDDYLLYMNTWVTNTEAPITDADGGGGLKMYGSAVWNHFIDGRWGQETILDAWVASTDVNNGPFAPASYETALTANGGTTFENEFVDFSVATAEWRVPGAGFPDVYPAVERGTPLTTGTGGVTARLDHTTFALRGVTVPSAPATLTLHATLPAGLKGAIALVGRTGLSDTAGTVTKQVARTTNGGALSVSLADAQSFGRITAVLVNADPTQDGWPKNPNATDWHFTKDDQDFTGVRVVSAAGPAAPVVTTAAATSLSSTGATLNGSVNPGGAATTYWFEYGATTAYGTETTHQSAGSGTSASSRSAAITGLQPGTTYHYRVVAQNSVGTTRGLDQTFTTLDPPIVTTGTATDLGLTAATLNGIVDPNGKVTTYHFEYGTTTAYGTQVPLTPASAGSAQTAVGVSEQIGGLTRGTTYHFRLVATSADGTTVGSDGTFTTLDPPIVTTGAASGIGSDSATLNGTVDPRGTATTYFFEYGTTAAYGSQLPVTPASAGSGTSATVVNAVLTGLASGTTYHFRVVAANEDGATAGEDGTFTTTTPLDSGGGGTVPGTVPETDPSTGGSSGTSGTTGSGAETPFALTLRLTRARLAVALRRGLRARAGCVRDCTITARARITRRLAKRLRLRSVTVASGRASPRAGATTSLGMRFNRTARRALARSRSVRLTLRLVASDGTGQRRTLVRRTTLRR